jgi:hypothetical protein
MAPNILRCSTEIGDHTDWDYLRNLGRTQTLLVTSERVRDDEFARKVIATAAEALQKRVPLPFKFPFRTTNSYGFDAIVAVPPNFHGVYEGMTELEDSRKGVVLCLPIDESELCGNELEADFRQIHFRKNFFDWRRTREPLCLFRCRNPRTGGGTIALKKFTFTSVSYCFCELKELNGVRDGFIDVMNYRNEVCEIRPKKRGQFSLTTPDGTREETMSGAIEFIGHFLKKKEDNDRPAKHRKS